MKIEVSNGEFVDKLTILEIKLNKIQDAIKLEKVQKEYDSLIEHLPTILSPDHVLYQKLYEVNSKLWDIEDQLRDLERLQDFNAQFIQLARSVYFTNDERANIKLQINQMTNSNLEEVKSYKQYSNLSQPIA